jgi:hypothetical protein
MLGLILHFDEFTAGAGIADLHGCRIPTLGNADRKVGFGHPASGPDRFEPCEAEARDRMAIRAQILEVTPDRQMALNLRIGVEAGNPRALSVFRSEHVPA